MLDLRTLSLLVMVCSLFSVIAVLTLWRLVPQEKSLRIWMTTASVLGVGMLLLALRGIAPDFISIVVANSMAALGVGFVYMATRQLFGAAPGRPWHWYAACAVFLVTAAFTYVVPSVIGRVVASSLFVAPFPAAAAWFFWRGDEPRLRVLGRITALIFASSTLLLLVRAALTPYATISPGAASENPLVFVIPYLYLALASVWMAIVLTLMVSSRLQRRVEESNGKLAEALDNNQRILLNSPLPMGVYRANGDCIQPNDAYARLIGATREELLAQNFHTLESWRRSGLLGLCLAALAADQSRNGSIQIWSQAGVELWLDCSILPIQIKHNQHLLIQFVDWTERKRFQDELRQHAFHDSLTRLPNRRLLLDRISQAIRISKREHSHFAVLYLDLNKFKQINDIHGHDVGDQLLIEVGNRLKRIVRDSDTVARIGGDEFVVLLEELGTEFDPASVGATTLAEKIRASLSSEYILGNIHYQGSAAIGTRLFVGDDDPERILKEADGAMYEDKRASRQ